MVKKKVDKKINIQNKKALFDYQIIKKLEAGVQLYGHEVKAVRSGKASLTGAHIVVRNSEAYLVNANISHYQEANTPESYDPNRTRKLLLNKKEVDELEKVERTKGLTVVALAWYNNNRRLKLEVAIAKGKKDYDKRESLKKHDTKRDMDRTLKGYKWE
ncbi:MAG: SsrA-binding protein SmpB [Candidatus Pacebacteria bacterium]|nr:SsrA-binding protein SmpB [Candidatus Paceibacterota bacterium]